MLAFVAWPLPPQLLDPDGALSVRLLDRDGHLLREIPSRRASRSNSLPADAPVPATLRDAFIASEDRRFEWHPGVDPLAVLRAAGTNLRAGRVVSGASTLTQQLARLLVPVAGRSPERCRRRSGRCVSLLTCRGRTFLRAYLDRVALGRDLVGAEAAAQAYFGRPARTPVGGAGRASGGHRPLPGPGRPLA
jgi:penicillin-binding protein 1C